MPVSEQHDQVIVAKALGKSFVRAQKEVRALEGFNLSVAPSQVTGTPRSRSTCATASAGKMWPPVPPAITMTGRSC